MVCFNFNLHKIIEKKVKAMTKDFPKLKVKYF